MLLQIHLAELVFQFFFIVVVSVVRFSPQVIMYALLQLLEQQSVLSVQYYKSAWSLVAALGFSMILSSWGDVWNQWVAFSRLSLPLRSELSIMVFTKTMKRRLVTAVRDSSEATTQHPRTGEEAPEPMKEQSKLKGENVYDCLDESRQAITNLLVSVSQLCSFTAVDDRFNN